MATPLSLCTGFIITLIHSYISLGFMPLSSPTHRSVTKLKAHLNECSPASTWTNPPFLALLTEPDACDSLERIEQTYHAIEQATIDGNVDLVVIRTTDDANDGSQTQRNAIKFELIRRLAQIKLNCQRNGTNFKLVINNDIEMAIASINENIAIDGVHVKERNINSISSIRHKLNEAADQSGGAYNIIMGTSCHSVKSAMDSYQYVDYIFVGTCYTTQSHPEKSLDDLEGPNFPGRIKDELKKVCTNSTSPIPKVFAIGGIDETNCHEPVLFGADGVGVIRSVMKAADPRIMTECIHKSMIDVKD